MSRGVPATGGISGNKTITSIALDPGLRAALDAIAETEAGGNRSRVVAGFIQQAARERGIDVTGWTDGRTQRSRKG